MAAIQTDPQYKLRLPSDLKVRIEQAAKDSNRSMNAEIVARLEASFTKVTNTDAATIRAAAQAAAEQVVHNFENVIQLLRFDISAEKLGLPIPSSLPLEQRRDAMRRVMKEEDEAEINESDEAYAGTVASEDYHISGLGAAFDQWFASLPDPKPDFQEAQNILLNEALAGRGFAPQHTGRESSLPPRRKPDPTTPSTPTPKRPSRTR